MIRKLYIALLLVLVTLVLCGCDVGSVSDLYSLPKRSEQYTNLQSVMERAMTGLEYSAPRTGDNQQTVQAADLDGDGQSEYILFAKGSSERPLQIFIFSGDGENYQLLDTIESTGSAFDRVEYIQMNDSPGFELVVGCQVSDQVVRAVSVYTLVGDQMEQLMSANYSEFVCCDMDGNGISDLLTLRPGDSVNGEAVRYSYENGNIERSQVSNMSEPAEDVLRIMVGKLHDGVRAVYVASEAGSGVITDIFALKDGQLTNVSFSSDSGTSVQTLRNYYVYAEDIDNDGVLELPDLITMKSTQEDGTQPNQYIIRWYAMTSDGEKVQKMYTYHNYIGGWYLRLDEAIAHRFAVTQKGSSYEFSLWDEAFTTAEKLMTLYVLTGQKREEQAVTDNRFVLYRSESTVYAADLEVASANYGMTQENMIECFNLILQAWKTGET